MALAKLTSLHHKQLPALGSKLSSVSNAFIKEPKQLLLIEPGEAKNQWLAWLWVKPVIDKSQISQGTQSNQSPTTTDPKQPIEWQLAQPKPISEFIGEDLSQWHDLPSSPILFQALPSQEFNSSIIQLKHEESEYWSELIMAQASQQQREFNEQHFHAQPLVLKKPESKNNVYFITSYLSTQQATSFPAIKQLSQAHFDMSLNLRTPPQQASLALIIEHGRLIVALGMAKQWLSWTPITSQLNSETLIQQVQQEITLLTATLHMQGLNWQSQPNKQLLITQGIEELKEDADHYIKDLINHLQQSYDIAAPLKPLVLPTLPSLPKNYTSYQPSHIQGFLARQRQKKIITYASLATLAACALLFMGVGIHILYLKTKLTQTSKQIADMNQQVAPVMQHINAWDSLAPVVNSEQWVLDILLACYKNASIQGLKLSQIQVQQGAIKIEGQAQSLKIANQFNLRISKNQFFDLYQWQLPPAKQDNQGNWNFSYQAYINTNDTL